MTRNPNAGEPAVLTDAQVDCVTGGGTSSIVGFSVDTQNVIALRQELSEAYQSTHPAHWPHAPH